ncbi:MAG: hypothetical protein Q9P90_12875 [candidate division KSB1 bacterium]|nr:hypothetical protein [candidate division KSB1 bacterium]
MTALYEKIHVYARSIGGKVIPLQFLWRQQRYDIYEVLDIKKKTTSRLVVYHFKVTTLPRGTFTLEFDLRKAQWYLLSAEYD